LERKNEAAMDDLAELQALLGAVQKQETKNRLNERNCRELLVKLIQKEFIEVRRACVRRGLVLTAGSLARVRVCACARTRAGARERHCACTPHD
jgi:hypothetical protein